MRPHVLRCWDCGQLLTAQGQDRDSTTASASWVPELRAARQPARLRSRCRRSPPRRGSICNRDLHRACMAA
eukprot:scaffold1428_cov259-Pinguiococcus_pyrenoidosus.AAC.9